MDAQPEDDLSCDAYCCSSKEKVELVTLSDDEEDEMTALKKVFLDSLGLVSGSIKSKRSSEATSSSSKPSTSNQRGGKSPKPTVTTRSRSASANSATFTSEQNKFICDLFSKLDLAREEKQSLKEELFQSKVEVRSLKLQESKLKKKIFQAVKDLKKELSGEQNSVAVSDQLTTILEVVSSLDHGHEGSRNCDVLAYMQEWIIQELKKHRQEMDESNYRSRNIWKGVIDKMRRFNAEWRSEFAVKTRTQNHCQNAAAKLSYDKDKKDSMKAVVKPKEKNFKIKPEEPGPSSEAKKRSARSEHNDFKTKLEEFGPTQGIKRARVNISMRRKSTSVLEIKKNKKVGINHVANGFRSEWTRITRSQNNTD